MALQDLLKISDNKKKIGISEERIAAIKKPLRQQFAFWRVYPDLFVDFMQTGGKPVYLNENGQRCYKNDKDEEVKLTFSLFFYQRVFLRIGMRYKYVYAVFPRASMAPNRKFYFRGQTSLIAGTLFSIIAQEIRR